MKIYEFRQMDISDVPAMVNLLVCRQNLEGKVFPFLKTAASIQNTSQIYLKNCSLIINQLG